MSAMRSVAGQIDPVPADVIAAARASFAWRSVDDELAALAYDSSSDAHAGAGLRSGSAITASRRSISFESDGSSVELEVEVTGDHRRLIGHVVPPSATSLEVRHPEATMLAEVDDMGRFVVDGVPAGPLSLRWTGGGGTVVSPWLLV